MTAPNTFRIAAAFQAEKDPQQDAEIAWLGSLPKDSRGGVKRSVMKYHLTRALLLYTQSGADMSTALHVGHTPQTPSSVPAPAPSVVPTRAAVAPVPVEPSVAPVVPVSAPVAAKPDTGIPVLTDAVPKKAGGLRNKIAKSMQGAGS